MRQLTYQLVFHTPAFLGNADQVAQWRTPPIKALLRQFWRVAYAASQPGAPSLSTMRRDEGRLFGHAWLDDDRDSHGKSVAARRAQVRLRLSHWDVGALSAGRWEPLTPVRHPDVQHGPVPADLYLGYGPVVLPPRGQRTPTLKSAAAIQSGAQALFSVACPEAALPQIQRALALMSQYGTLGGRSRNGWGSFSLSPQGDTPALDTDLPPAFTMPWRDALAVDWAQAVGSDARGALLWTTPAQADWRAAMVELARVKIGLRTQFVFPDARPDGHVNDRHWLSYPVTHHEVAQWKRQQLRLPNSLRFKVRPDRSGKLRGLIVHMPCLPPPAFDPDRRTIERIWQKVHDHLDAAPALSRATD